jgi:hypothetical protein
MAKLTIGQLAECVVRLKHVLGDNPQDDMDCEVKDLDTIKDCVQRLLGYSGVADEEPDPEVRKIEGGSQEKATGDRARASDSRPRSIDAIFGGPSAEARDHSLNSIFSPTEG